MIVVLFIFTQLWGVTYEVTGKDRIAGFSLPMMMWYLTVTESIMMAYPPLVERVEQEVKSGQVAVTLIRPFSYVAAHFSAYLAEFILRLFINLAIGGALVFLLFGPPEMGPGQVGAVSPLSARVPPSSISASRCASPFSPSGLKRCRAFI